MRLIDADVIIIDLLDRGIESVQTDDYAEFQQIVEDAPTVDAVLVVRCKDCKWRPRNMSKGVNVEYLDFPLAADGIEVCPYAADDPWYNKDPHPYGFCHLGMREEGADDDN